MSLAKPFRKFVDDHKDKDVQICLKGGGPMSGRVTYDIHDAHEDNPVVFVYQIICEAQIGPNTNPVKLPFRFEAESILWYSPGPIADEGSKIVTGWGS